MGYLHHQNLQHELLDSTAVCGKPHVRWCGRGNGRNPVTPTRSGKGMHYCSSCIPQAPYRLHGLTALNIRVLCNIRIGNRSVPLQRWNAERSRMNSHRNRTNQPNSAPSFKIERKNFAEPYICVTNLPG